MPSANEHRDGAQTVHKVAAVLRALRSADGRGLAAHDIARECGLARSTAHRILAALKSEGLVTQPPAGRLYYLGPQCYDLGLVASPILGIRELCGEVVSELARLADATCFLTMRSGLDGVCVDRVTAGSAIEALNIDIGSRRPLGVGLGSIAILAALPPPECETVVRANGMRYGEWSRLGVSHIKSMVIRTRKNGYAFTANDYIDDIGGFALAIRTPDTRLAFAAISVASHVSRMPSSQIEEFLPLLRSAVLTIEARLRYRIAGRPRQDLNAASPAASPSRRPHRTP